MKQDFKVGDVIMHPPDCPYCFKHGEGGTIIEIVVYADDALMLKSSAVVNNSEDWKVNHNGASWEPCGGWRKVGEVAR